MTDQPRSGLLQHTADVVSAHLSHNQIGTDALPQLIQSVYQTLAGLGIEPQASIARPVPAVPIRKSVFPNYIVCLEDGAKLTMLKRYLMKRHGLTPEAYRERWGLPDDYPMVAPSYAEKRSALARQSGLGRKAVEEQPAEDGTEIEEEAGADKELDTRSPGKASVAEAEE